ncbi:MULTISPECIES: GH3 auxin-responsive promoter family protein [Bradyrhizobium]|uniref:GH3 auxin-responsive promoter family protein n=2 Tax=Nitrobacteraceae TaxID=41294 RepID=UPI001AEE1869|nr:MULTISPECIES: GH3 auxin-responsive promoter family protein [Bradyrhizobium]
MQDLSTEQSRVSRIQHGGTAGVRTTSVGGAADDVSRMARFCAQSEAALDRQRLICQSPHATVGTVFHDVLRELTGTAFEREHALAGVCSFDEFRRAVPIRSYGQLRGYIDRQLARERKVLTRDDPYAFLKTSGTTGQAKLVPTTRHWRLAYRGPALYAQWGLYFRMLRLDTPKVENVLDLSWEPQTARQSIHGFPVYSITQRPEPLGESDWLPPWYGAPWFSCESDPDGYAERLYQRLCMQAFCDVRLIVSVNPSKIIMLAETLRQFATRLIRDVRGSASAAGGQDLARRLEGQLKLRGGELLLSDLWPNLSLIVCWNSASAQLYENWLDRLVPDATRLPFSTTGTEGIVTLPVDMHRSAGPLAVTQGLYEFVPVDDILENVAPSESAETLTFEELEVGRCYRLVMTQANGLYRYDVGDVYRVVGWVGAVPRLEFIGRSGACSSFTGEKLTEADVFSAVSRTIESGSAGTPNFCCFPVWGTPPHYAVALEWSPKLELMQATLATRIDAALSRVNLEYADKLSSGRLAPLTIVKLVPGAFARLAEHKISGGVASAQVKHHWLQRDASGLKILRDIGMLLDGAGSFIPSST